MVFDTNKSTQKYLYEKYNRTVISKQEYASETGESVSTVDSKISKNEGIAGYIKLGKSKNAKIVFPISEVAAFLSNTVEVDNGL